MPPPPWPGPSCSPGTACSSRSTTSAFPSAAAPTCRLVRPRRPACPGSCWPFGVDRREGAHAHLGDRPADPGRPARVGPGRSRARLPPTLRRGRPLGRGRVAALSATDDTRVACPRGEQQVAVEDRRRNVDELSPRPSRVVPQQGEGVLLVDLVALHEDALGTLGLGAPAEGTLQVVVLGEAAEGDVEGALQLL